MTYATSTLANLKQSLADKHDSGTLPTDTATLTYWARLLNEAQHYCAQKLRLEKNTTVTTSSCVGTLPEDFIFAVKILDSDNNEYTQVAHSNLVNFEGNYYSVSGDHATGFKINIPSDSSDDTFTIHYAYRPSPMSSDSDECLIADPEAVVLRAYGKLRLAETDPLDDAQPSLEEADTRLDELISHSNLNDQFLGFTTMEGA